MSDDFKSYTVTLACRGSALSSDERHLLTAMAMRASRAGVCWASVATLHDDTAIRERTIQRCAKRLVSLGVLVVVDAPEHRTRTYRIDASAIPVGVRVADEGVRVADEGDSVTPDPSIPSTPSMDPSYLTVCVPPPQLRLVPLEEAPTVPDATPKWAKVRGHVSAVVLAACVRAIEAITGRPQQPERCATNAAHVIGLQRVTETPWEEPADEIAQVAAWARDAPSAENDIRGLRPNGERWGTDRSRSVATLCVHSRWADRLGAARRWASGHVPPVRRGPPRPHWLAVGGEPASSDDDDDLSFLE